MFGICTILRSLLCSEIQKTEIFTDPILLNSSVRRSTLLAITLPVLSIGNGIDLNKTKTSYRSTANR